ncbi:retrovirus-related pol polyprotein from transposon TNT 1-94 [Tanacetum coccineum]
MHVIEQPLPPAPEPVAEPNVVDQWTTLYDAHTEIACLMLGSMTPELHRQFELYYPFDMIQELRSMFEKQAGVEKFDLIQSFHACKQEEGKPVADYVLKMKGYVEKLERLGYKKIEASWAQPVLSNKRVKHNLDSTYLWHCRLAHINKKRIKQLQQDGLLKSTDDESFDKCESCLSGKMTKKPFPHSNERAKDLLGIIHTDVCGPLRHVSRQGASYFITFTDDYSRYGYVYLLKHKHEVFETFKVFKNEVENQLGKTIKAIRSDRGGEYISQEFKDYLKANGIVQQLTPPYTPQHNGVSERRNRTLLDMVRSMMNLTTLPLSFWDYALESATRILNMVPTKKVDKTPYELWYGKVPNLSYLKVWGCEALVKRDTPDKLEQRSVKCIFIGYPKETMGYYFYFPPENKIVVARYAEFFEKRLISQEISGRAVDLDEIQEEEDTTTSDITSNIPQEAEGFEPPQEEVIPIRRSERTHRAPNRLCLNVEVEEHSLGDLNEPTSYKAAMLDLESNKWIDAMNAEIQSMMDNMVWVLVDLPPGCKTVGSRWLFKKKTDMDGIVHVYKARLVAKGYTQLYGVDYEETFSPVADIRAIRILISIAAYYDYEIWQMDVKTAFLNGYLDEDIYMVQPEGFVDPNHPRKVCKLQRSIYGLKQASRSWNKRFDEEIKRFGFAQNLDEPCVYQKASGSNVTFLILYVDDIIIMGNHIPSLQSVKDYLRKCFAMKDLGEVTFILGIKIYRDRSKRLIRLGQNYYMDKILKRYRMDNSKCGHIPMQERLDLNKTQEAEYIAGSKAAMEAVWIRKFISGLGIGEIIFLKVHIDDNLADSFTKALPKGKLTQHARSMGLQRLFSVNAARGLVNLKTLTIFKCSNLKEVIWDGDEDVDIDKVEFPRLVKIELRYLYVLKCFYAGKAADSDIHLLAGVGPLSGKGPRVIVSADVSILPQSVFVGRGATGAAFKEHLDAVCSKYFVPEEIHPQLPGPDDTMHERPAGKVGMYTRFFDYANYRIPFSNFFVSVLTHFRISFFQLFIFGSAKNWNDHFFWVDEFVVPASARFGWFSGTNIVRDRAPTVSEYNVEHANTLIAQASPFLRFPKEFICWVGISRNYLFNKDIYPRFEYEGGEEMNLNAFIRTNDPRKVRIVERARTENERPIMTVAKHHTVTLLPTSVLCPSGELCRNPNNHFTSL